MTTDNPVPGVLAREEFEVYCIHSMVKWWCQGCVQGHARRVERENEKLRAQVTALSAALESIGTDCRYEANENRCALIPEHDGPPEWRWCGGCVAWAALHSDENGTAHG